MDKRTLRRILNSLDSGEVIKTHIQGYRYEVDTDGDEVSLRPLGNGSIASSALGADQYEFTHGGPIFREAVQIAKQIMNALREKRAGSDAPPAFLKDLAWNGQISRWFDASGTEYDLAPSNAAVARGEKMFQVTFTSPAGYEITHVFNE